MTQCGLPRLPGAPPLGGEILSHDFVESALMRRGGWGVYLLARLEGSYEEVPTHLLDYACRDRRWSQGNLQHLKLLGARGLHPLSRLHFLLGALAYGSSLLWLLMLLLSTVDAVGRALSTNDYFLAAHQLFPDWPVTKTHEILSLLGLVVAMLLLPKLLGLLECACRRERRQAFGGLGRLLGSAFGEILFSVAIAPTMMVLHARFVSAVLCGRSVSWAPQTRDGAEVSWTEALRHTGAATLGGLAWALGTAPLAPFFFWVMTPVTAGLILAAPLVRGSSNRALGRLLDRAGIFRVPAETAPPPVLEGLRDCLSRSVIPVQGDLPVPGIPLAEALRLPPDRPGAMPVQRLDSGSRWSGAGIPARSRAHQPPPRQGDGA
jgi:membrane glycosyltransferase